MKKSLLVLASFCTCAGLASAQSSVTVYGTLDVNGRYVKNDGSAKRVSLSQDGLNQSQLGFRGIEDLGDGLKAGFVLLSTINPDTGSTNGKFWNRRSTVSLFSNAGEIRLGRDWVPTFWNNALFDAFGASGIGNSFNVWQVQALYATSPAFGNFARADNSIGYFLPGGLGGVYGQAMVAASEGASNQGRVVSARVGYAAGPFDIAVAGLQQRFDLASAPAVTGITAGSKQNTFNVGASYDFGSFKLLSYAVRDSRDNLKETRGSVSGIVRLGQGEIHLAYERSKLTNDIANNSNTVSQFAAGYVYNLSKRTAIYGTAARLSNGDHPLAGSVPSVAGWNAAFAGTAQTAAPVVGGKSTGLELGVRHFF